MFTLWFNRFLWALFCASVILPLVACGPSPAPVIVASPAQTEIPWSYKIQAQHTIAADGSFTTVATIWAKTGLDVGTPVLKWNDGFQIELEWSKESLPFDGHPISEAILIVDGEVKSNNLFGYHAENTINGGFLAHIP